MELHIWWTFLIGTVLICGSPGPNMLQVMATGARYGFRHAFFAMAGCFIPVFVYIVVSLLGVGALLAASPAMFDLLRYAGAAYLIYLGIQAWRAKEEIRDEHTPYLSASPKKIFLHSFLVGISNPKAILFATAYFPQFLNPEAPQAIQFAILLGTFSVVEIGWYILYATGGSWLTAALKKARVRQAFDRITGSIFIFFGVALLAKSR